MVAGQYCHQVVGRWECIDELDGGRAVAAFRPSFPTLELKAFILVPSPVRVAAAGFVRIAGHIVGNVGEQHHRPSLLQGLLKKRQLLRKDLIGRVVDGDKLDSFDFLNTKKGIVPAIQRLKPFFIPGFA